MPTDQTMEKFLAAGSASMDDKLPFKCRGCGHLCCTTDDPIIMNPAEYARAAWEVMDNPQLAMFLMKRNIHWAAFTIGHNSGFPFLYLETMPGTLFDQDHGQHCIFMSPVLAEKNGETVYTGMSQCAIHNGRPNICRLYPLGRSWEIDPAKPGKLKFDYRVASTCPGFEPPEQDEILPPNYDGLDPNQTIGDWIARNIPDDIQEETEFWYGEIFPLLADSGLFMRTEINPNGLLNEFGAEWLGQYLLYNIPRRPQNPADYHKTIMAWLRIIKNVIPDLIEVARENAAIPVMMPAEHPVE